MTSERARRARRRRRVDLTARTAEASTVPQPRGKPGGPGLFGIKGAQLPPYIQHVRDELMKKDPDESKATEGAIGIVRNWAEGHDGHGHKVSADVQAAAAKNIAAYEALRARAKATPNKGRHDMSHPYVGGLLQPGQWVGEAGPTLIKFDNPTTVHSHAVTSAAVDAYQAATVDLAAPWDPNKHPRGGKGSAAGGKFVPVGAARNQKAAQAQKSKAGSAGYKAAGSASGAERSKLLKGMSDAALQAASREAYSFKTSDPKVVALRIAIANEMGRRGFDVKDFGALGGGINSDKGTKQATARAKAVGSSKTTKAQAYTARHGTPAEKRAALKALQAKTSKKKPAVKKTPKRPSKPLQTLTGGKAVNMSNPARKVLDLAKLTAKRRKKLPPSQFAVPGKKAYPVHDAAHAKAALARVAQFGTAAEKAAVVKAVRRKYPNMKIAGKVSK